MKIFRSTFVAALAAGLCLADISARADMINGDISFNATAKTNTGNLGTATAFTKFSNVQVAAGTQDGAYGSVPDNYAPVTFTPFSFSAPGVTPLWTFTVDGITYSFNATSITVDTQNSTFLDISGNGIAYITGYDATPGTWSITDTHVGNGATFVFGASTTAGGDDVPDRGTTALLVALGLGGIVVALASRRAKAPRA